MPAKEEVIFTIIVVILILIFMAIMFLVFLTRNKTRKNQLIYENERIRREYEDALLHTRLEIQEHTMNYISSEIHDNIGQTLSLARIQLNNDEEPESGAMADSLLGRAITDLRSLSHTLNTNYIREIGLVAAVKALAQQFEATGKYRITLNNLPDSELYIGEERELIIFRVIQEVLNNVTKHANASEISIDVHQHEGSHQISITDDGVGFDVEGTKSAGIGLRNMKDRIDLIGGRLLLESEPGKGTTVKIMIADEM